MPPFVIAIIVILVVHYFLAIATIFVLMKDKGLVKAIIPWNLVILARACTRAVRILDIQTFCKKKMRSRQASEGLFLWI